MLGNGFCQPDNVAPLAGAWVEIRRGSRCIRSAMVAPLAGAWVEIVKEAYKKYIREGRSRKGSDHARMGKGSRKYPEQGFQS